VAVQLPHRDDGPPELAADDRAWSQYLLETHGVHRVVDWQLEGASIRVWLVDDASLQSVLEGLTGLLQRRRLARVIGRAQRDALRSAWSEATWFAASDGSAPSIDSTTLPALADEDESPRTSARLLRGLIGAARPAIAERARLRLPRAWRDDGVLEMPEGLRSELADWIARCWIPQRSPAWGWLF
jgi:hypothetical protein